MIEKLRQGDEVPFTQVSNAMLTDRRLSLKCKGLLAYMLSKPEDWQFNVRSMSAELAENKDTVARILKVLIEARYVTREEIRENGQVKGYVYSVYQSPCLENEDRVDSPCPQTPDTVNGDIPNKDKQTNKEGGSSYVEPSTAPPPGLKAQDLFAKIRDVREIYTDIPPPLTSEEKTRAVEAAKKYGANAFLEWLADAAARKPGKPLKFLFQDFGHLLKPLPATQVMKLPACEECKTPHPPGTLIDWEGEQLCIECATKRRDQQPVPERMAVGADH